MTEDLFGYDEGKRRKEEGIEKVSENNEEWLIAALDFIRRIRWGTEFVAFDWKYKIIEECGHPTRPNAWGALWRMARWQKLVKGLGIYQKSAAPKNNGHPYEKLRKI